MTKKEQTEPKPQSFDEIWANTKAELNEKLGPQGEEWDAIRFKNNIFAVHAPDQMVVETFQDRLEKAKDPKSGHTTRGAQRYFVQQCLVGNKDNKVWTDLVAAMEKKPLLLEHLVIKVSELAEAGIEDLK